MRQPLWITLRGHAISRGHYHWQHECCFYAVKKGSTGHWHGGRNQSTLWQIDALPGDGVDANARLSTLACLAHELAHAERFQLGYHRPTDLPDVLLDEAETSPRASFTSVLCPKDREDLVEDARDRLIQWLALRQQEGETDAQS